MTSPELERLAGLGHLKREPPGRAELEGLIRSGAARLADAGRKELSPESRFDLAYNAAHSLALAALRWQGYRTDKRYFVFQALPHTLRISASITRLLAKCHQQRNQVEYGGLAEIDESLLTGLVEAGKELLSRVRSLSLPEDPEQGDF